MRVCAQLFPYHLAEHVCRDLRVSPFRYYIDLLCAVLREEQSYDQIPNFTVRAASSGARPLTTSVPAHASRDAKVWCQADSARPKVLDFPSSAGASCCTHRMLSEIMS